MNFRDCVIVLAAFIAMNGLGSVQAEEPVKEKATLKGHTEGVRCLTFSPNGKTLASGSMDNSIKLWDVATGKNASLKMKDFSVYSLAFSPDGKTLAAGGEDEIVLWSLATGKHTTLRDGGSRVIALRILFSPDGKTLASGGSCGYREMKLWNVTGGKCTATLGEYDINGVRAMAFTADSKTLVSMGFNDGIKLWDVATGKNTDTQKIEDGVRGAAFSPDGKTLATWSGSDSTVKLWEMSSGKLKAAFKGPTEDTWELMFSPDGKTLVTANGNDLIVNLWDANTGKNQATLKGHTDHVLCLAFSPDGQTLASGSDDNTIKLWDVSPRR
jgi:WD40 repeat protein